MTRGLVFSCFILGGAALGLTEGCTATLANSDEPGGAGGSADATDGAESGGDGAETGGAAGAWGGGTPPPAVQRCDTLYRTFEPQGEPRYEEDILPVFRTTCNMSICHGGDPSEAQAGLWLGRLDTEEMTEAEIAYSYDALLDVRSKAIPELALLRKDRPRDSLLMLKIDDCFEHPSLECALDDPTLGPCGDPMPVLADPLTEETRSLIRSWIATGARP